MQIPLQIHFNNVDPSPAVESAIHKRAAQLERFGGEIVSCRVTIVAPHKHHHKGNLFYVTVDLRTPGRELVVSRSPQESHANEDVYVAIRDAFKAARRQLQDHMREQRGKVKSHDTPPHGKITHFYPADDYGTITDSGGREIYFHRNSVVNADFDKLGIDTEVRFAEEAGDEGPQASSVYIVGKRHTTG